jgi:hypothetical protein
MLHNLLRNWPVMMEASTCNLNLKKCLLSLEEKWGW